MSYVNDFDGRREYVALITAFLIAAAGAVANYYWPCSNAFPRSGSLIVCAAIVFGLRDLKLAYQQAFRIFASEQETKRLENDIVFGDKELKEKVRGTTDQRVEAAEKDAKKSGERAVRLDAIILVTGTLIWGFGDLLASKFGAWLC